MENKDTVQISHPAMLLLNECWKHPYETQYFNRRTQWRIQHFPLGGANLLVHWGRRPPTQVFFDGNACENERIRSCWGGSCLVQAGGAPPPDPPMGLMHLGTKGLPTNLLSRLKSELDI